MELLLSRSQKSGLAGMGAPTFVLDVRSQLTSEENEYVQRYKLGKTVLYEKASVRSKIDQSGPLGQLFTMLMAKASGRIFTISDFVHGRRIECKNIIEMVDAEVEIKKAADAFHTVLMTCGQFGGEEVVKFPRED
jgi:hypothetical protein